MQVPRPWHSMKGIFRNSSRQEPGEARGCPEPSAPAPVCCTHTHMKKNMFQHFRMCVLVAFIDLSLHPYHDKRVASPQGEPTWRTRGDLCGLTVDSDHVCFGLTHSTPKAGQETQQLGMNQYFRLMPIRPPIYRASLTTIYD